MNKSNSASKIKMKSFDDLFGTNENLEQANANGGEIREIPLASLHIFPNIEQSARLKASCRENMLTQEEVRNIMLPEQVLAKPRKVTFKADRLDDYFDEGYTEEKITEVIINLLDEWKKRGERA